MEVLITCGHPGFGPVNVLVAEAGDWSVLLALRCGGRGRVPDGVPRKE